MRSQFPFALSVGSLCAAIAGCSFGALSGFSGGAAEDADAVDAGGPGAEASTERPTGTSCADIKRRHPDAADGRYAIDPDGPGSGPPFEAYCDMTADEGGWMLVTEDMIGNEDDANVTRVRSIDDKGGFAQTVYTNAGDCSPPSTNRTLIKDVIPWKQLRAHYTFRGAAACWAIVGGRADGLPAANIVPFTLGTDVVRDAKRMGGSAGDAFDGTTQRCDNETANFWHASNGEAARSMVAIVRRESDSLPAGLATLAACSHAGPGTSSPTSWEYREIYIR